MKSTIKKKSQLYMSNHNRIKEVDLFLIENKHYVCIKNLKPLL